ncbi:small basic family protein [Candidatus Pseudoscillospira sp. SGI.172]|uniref:small basic family protein n=1 Tax=Candidatus Pseudoscillospira sp. SGI.172 TaxID=3420582 RepID=UPI003D014C8E
MLELIGLTAGLLLGFLIPLHFPASMTLYVGVGLLAALDSALGGMRSRLKGEFHLPIFLSGTIGNAAIAVFLTALGERMGIPMYLAAVVVFGTRMFQNFGEIRRELLTSKPKKDKIKQDVEPSGEFDTK